MIFHPHGGPRAEGVEPAKSPYLSPPQTTRELGI